MLYDILSANVFLWIKTKGIYLLYEKRGKVQRYLMKKVNKPRILCKKIALQIFTGRPLQSDHFAFARLPDLSAVRGHFPGRPPPPPFALLWNVFCMFFRTQQ